ncbi:MAG: fibronectin-binding domain-containing protein [Acidobacteria bacterium]|nr:fibronectin-binding domain-containing protein [Acidobacteriota bacterium]
MDNFLLHAIANELAELLTGMVIGKAFQIGTTDVRIEVRGRWLAISTDPARLALYLTDGNWKKTESEARSDTTFPALLKKYLSGARIVGVEKLGYDRVVKFDLQAFNEDGSSVARQLIVTLIGRAANVMMVEAGRVIASLRERRDENALYEDPAPPKDKLDPFQVTAKQLAQLIAASNGDVAEAAHIHLLGVTNLYAAELAHRVVEQDGILFESQENKIPSCSTALTELLDELFKVAPQATIYSSQPLAELREATGDEALTATLAPILLRHLASQHAATFPNANAAADAYYSLLTARRAFAALRQSCQTHLQTRLKKQRQLLINLEREQAAFVRGEQHQRYGELLLANAHQALKEGDTFLVTDYYDEAQATLELPALQTATVQECAERYFKLARKARHGIASLNARLPQLRDEIALLENHLEQLPQQTRLDDLTAFASVIGLRREKRQLPTTPHKPTAKAPKLTGVRRYLSTDGFEILVGRSNTDNDHLTLRIAKSHDLWLHAADYAGSHVVLRNPQRKPVPPQALLEAAQLAAKFCQARTEARIGVNYCERKFVTKPKGFAPGQVRLSSFKTILVEPKEAGERVME